jgi:hypothetical protein
MQAIEEGPVLARLHLAPRCIFSKSPCIFPKSRELPDRDWFAADCPVRHLCGHWSIESNLSRKGMPFQASQSSFTKCPSRRAAS